MPATNTDDTDPSEQTDLLDAMGDSKSESQSHSEYADSGSPPDHEAEYENSPSVRSSKRNQCIPPSSSASKPGKYSLISVGTDLATRRRLGKLLQKLSSKIRESSPQRSYGRGARGRYTRRIQTPPILITIPEMMFDAFSHLFFFHHLPFYHDDAS
ncbi:uncharacterized protein BT62DRAFT_1010825 [Guyanagaster necrorhizus]|uniref:Uncharacterized protein n=1 Tax=Guyanagaster necrorhizus TaxID=856835 RepID=A0A9P8ANL4_9AGAR|nr:uncharacterized protein BT62DRAFT_1010825 [Guyanagaster necrorhizus MCA 3950]KAG7442040.1 hypothetical protein BT62DRAFT_1010825 [Guyanagaster necrorhizus MCA 3950]